MHKLQQDAFKIFQAGVQAVAPRKLVSDALKVSRDKLVIRDREYPLNHNVHVVAFGKAVLGMVEAAENILCSHIVQGVASVPCGTGTPCIVAAEANVGLTGQIKSNHHTTSPIQGNVHKLASSEKIEIVEGARDNLPDEKANTAAMKIMEIAKNVGKNDILLVLVSGGGSALLPLPVPEITLEEKLQTTKILSYKGASIDELNTIRKHLSQIKGGKLAQAAWPALVITLILSDVLGDPMDIIACGPTVPDLSTKRDCLEIIEKLNADQDLPVNVVEYLRSKSDSRETPKFSHVHNIIIGNNKTAVDGASLTAQELGYGVIVHNTYVSGEARDVGKVYASLGMSHVADTKKLGSRKPVCIIGAGETTVSVQGSGRGGRNQELALAAAIEMNKFRYERNLLLLSAGTDGQDGPTPAAGAYAYPSLVTMAAAQGLDAMTYLKNNDSFSFYTEFEDGKYLVKTGLTGTNVMDLQVMLTSPID